ncbi:cytochrome P450 [Aspergillus alliaceus]|uniref:cytochrome P450 n=1 Tax=Petromyces alliaceus TaxID=209559 RepID=UPI0012A52D14|nr:cytochrome P450 [Aspergillus alliaceus]KAB8238244.1 cytochrome P450 [Aspergillus alliaceus]
MVYFRLCARLPRFGLLSTILYRISLIIYRVYFHRLSGIPGPRLYAASFISYLYQDSIVRIFVIHIHEKHGPFIRIAPNHRRVIRHAFSEIALAGKEQYITVYKMRLLKSRIEAGGLVDMTRWYNHLTFDPWDLATTDPFDCLQRSEYHTFVAVVFSSIRAQRRADKVKKNQEFKDIERIKTEKRIAQGVGTREVIMPYILRHNKEGTEITHEETMTTATALAGLTFHLTQNPEVYRLLADKIRSSFAPEDEINLKSTSTLRYLRACPEEILHIYPPAAETLPRISPGATTNSMVLRSYVSIFQWATHHSPRNFIDPELFASQRWLPWRHPLYDPRYISDNKASFLAYAEMQLVTARLLWNFDIQLQDRQDDWVQRQRTFVLRLRAGL